MKIEKDLRKNGIEVIRELNVEEKKKIVKDFVEKLETIFPRRLEKESIMRKMFSCNMYFSRFSFSICTANYFYKNQSIYIDINSKSLEIDEYIIHECIHYFQDNRESGKLNKIGLCTFSEFSVDGLALNEAMIQYITSKMLGKKSESYQFGNITVTTHSKDYYPLLCNLIEQLIYLMGEEELIDSTLFSNEKFQIHLRELCGENAFKNIAHSFDKILNFINNHDLKYLSIKQKEKLEQYFEEAQDTILLTYFDGIFPLLETIEEVEEYREKLLQYKTKRGEVKEYDFYEKYIERKEKEIEKKILKISRKNSVKTPLIIHTNKVLEVFRNIRNIFTKTKNDSKY